MNADEFRRCAKELVDMVADYLESVRDRDVLPDVKPGYLQKLLPQEAPEDPEPWQDVLRDIEPLIMTGMTHWNSPHFHAYFPTANSYPAMCADILCGALSCIGFTWMASPACTELEMVMMDWLAQVLKLPEEFLFKTKGPGGGVIQSTASEASLVALLAARSHTLAKEGVKLEKLIAYSSEQSHSSVERAALLGAVQMRSLPTDKDLSLRGETVVKAIQEDRKKGFVPFIVIATLGSTNTCAFDNIKEIGSVCVKEKIWLHVDAAYAGSAFICPEFRPLLNGIEFADSFNFNPHKWMLVNFDCSAMWVRDCQYITEAFSVNPTYLKHEREGEIPDYRHWQIPLGRRFRSLKLWFVMRMYGVKGLREHIRKHVKLAKQFEKLILEDEQFELFSPVVLGLVCFRLKGSDELNEKLMTTINHNRKIHMTPTKVNGKYVLRFAVCSRDSTPDDVQYAWKEIKQVAASLGNN